MTAASSKGLPRNDIPTGRPVSSAGGNAGGAGSCQRSRDAAALLWGFQQHCPLLHSRVKPMGTVRVGDPVWGAIIGLLFPPAHGAKARPGSSANEGGGSGAPWDIITWQRSPTPSSDSRGSLTGGLPLQAAAHGRQGRAGRPLLAGQLPTIGAGVQEVLVSQRGRRVPGGVDQRRHIPAVHALDEALQAGQGGAGGRHALGLAPDERVPMQAAAGAGRVWEQARAGAGHTRSRRDRAGSVFQRMQQPEPGARVWKQAWSAARDRLQDAPGLGAAGNKRC